MANSTVCPNFLVDDLTSRCITPTNTYPFYYNPGPSQFQGINDVNLALWATIAAYWFPSLIFHFFDQQSWKWLERARIHESEEVTKRNKVTKSHVVKMVLLQQLVQSIAGVYWVSEKEIVPVDEGMRRVGSVLELVIRSVFGTEMSRVLLRAVGSQAVYMIYWWAIPIFQFICAIFFIDTWQYALHRSMHIFPFLYKHVHSVHHRLYVPYAFGALYNHPVEGFLLDSCGALLAEAVTFMSTRQATLLFFVATMKTVDDHCGYRFPYDPFQMFSGNNADYHDIHHQQIGIKSNFAQPFFVHWDKWMGTRMTRQEMEKKIADRRAKKE